MGGIYCWSPRLRLLHRSTVALILLGWLTGLRLRRESCNAHECTLPALHRFLFQSLEFPGEGEKGWLGMLR